MAIRRRTTFPGIDPKANKELISLQDDILREQSELRDQAIGSTQATLQIGTLAAKFNSVIPCIPQASGVDIVFPAATGDTQNRWIDVVKNGGGNIRLRPTGGRIQGSTLVTLTTNGSYRYKSDAQGGWWTHPSSTGGLSPPVALTDLQSIADETFLANVSGGAAPPSAVNLSSLAGSGLTWNSGSNALDVSAAGIAPALVRLIASMRA